MEWIILIVVVIVAIWLISKFLEFLAPIFFSLLSFMSNNSGLMFIVLIAFLTIRYIIKKNKTAVEEETEN